MGGGYNDEKEGSVPNRRDQVMALFLSCHLYSRILA